MEMLATLKPLKAVERYPFLCYLSLLIFLVYADTTILGTLLDTIQKKWHINSFWAGLLGSMNPIGLCFSSVICSRLSEKYRPLNIIYCGMVVWLIGTTISGVSFDYGLLVVGRILVGFGGAPIYTLTPVLVNEAAPDSSKGLWMGIVNVMTAFGAAMGPLFANGIDEGTGRFQDAFLFETVIMSAVLLFGVSPCIYKRYIKTSKKARYLFFGSYLMSMFAETAANEADQEALTAENGGAVAIEEVQSADPVIDSTQDLPNASSPEELIEGILAQSPKMSLSQELRALAANSVFVFFVITLSLAYYPSMVFMTFGNEYLQKQYGVSQTDASLTFTIINAFAALLLLPLGTYFYDRTIAKNPQPTKDFRCRIACKFIFWGFFAAGLIGLPSVLSDSENSFIFGVGASYAITLTVTALSFLACINAVPDELVKIAVSVTLISVNAIAIIPVAPLFGVLADATSMHTAMIICFIPIIPSSATGVLTWMCSCYPRLPFRQQVASFWRRGPSDKKKSEKLLSNPSVNSYIEAQVFSFVFFVLALLLFMRFNKLCPQ